MFKLTHYEKSYPSSRMCSFHFIFFKKYCTGQEVYFGIKGGISIPNLSSGGSGANLLNSGYSSRLGPDFAIMLETRCCKIFLLCRNLEYHHRAEKRMDSRHGNRRICAVISIPTRRRRIYCRL